MNENQIQEYLTQIGMGEPLSRATLNLIRRYHDVCPNIGTVFVSEYIEAAGTRRFGNVVVFSQAGGRIIEFSSVLEPEPRVYVASLNYGLAGLELRSENFDLRTATEASRLLCNVRWANPPSFELVLRATGSNCDNLRQIVLTLFVPRFT